MSICPKIGLACCCQPDDGLPCPYDEAEVKRVLHGWRDAALKAQARVAELESAAKPSVLPEQSYTQADVERLLEGIERDAKRHGLELVCHAKGGIGLRAWLQRQEKP